MGKRIGTLLEKNIEKIFRLAGFITLRNLHMKGYEVDVLAEWNDLKIIIQCKQYERSRLNLQDVIHEWNSKNQIIKADKIIIVVFGQDVEEWQRELANQFGIILWGEPEMDEVETLVINKGVNSLGDILEMLNLKESVRETPIRTREMDLMNVAKVFGFILLLIWSIAFPPFFILFIIFVIWLVYHRKNVNIRKKKSKTNLFLSI